MTLTDGLACIVSEYGIEVINDSKRLTSLIMDYVIGCEKEKKLFRIACKCGILKDVMRIRSSENAQQEILIKKTIKRLEDEEFVSFENAEYIVSLILNGVGITYEGNAKEKNEPLETRVTAQTTQTITETKKISSPVNTNTDKSEDHLRNIVYSNAASSIEDRETICELGRKKLINRDFDEGFKYVQYAGKKGSMNGAILLGYCYDAGLGVRQDKKIAEAYYRQGTISNPEFKSFYQRKYGIGRDLFEAAARAAERMLKTTYMPIQPTVAEKKAEVKQSVESKPATVQQTSTSLFQSIKGKIFGSEKDKENHLWSIVNEKRRPTNDESAAILNLGRRLLKNGNTADGIKLIKYTAQYGYAYGALLLGYCYDNGIGVPKDYNIASAYYDRAGVSGGADESYKFHGWGDRTHRSRAYAVAEKIYNEKL